MIDAPDLGRRRAAGGDAMGFAVLAILLLAGIVHIATILTVPHVATRNGWSRLSAFASVGGFGAAPAVGPNALPGLDPLFVHGACRLQLGAAPAGISFRARDRFWSLALYERRGNIVFSLNDRTALDGRLDMLVVTPVQNAQLKESPPDDIDQTIVVESPAEDIVALLRLYAPTDAARREAEAILGGAECAAAPFVETAPEAPSQ